jgi:hypothetical protein
MARRAMPDVVVLLPGILGSVLRKDGRDLWAASGGAVLAALLSRGDSIRELTLVEDSLDDDLGDGVTADRLMPDVHLLPGLWKIDGYSRIRQAIETTFDVTEGENYFEFPYDWRRDNRVAAQRLQRTSHDWLRNWRSTSGSGDARLILIAHSMGGIVARYFLEVLEGWRNAKALITFGTPYRGALNALEALTNGVSKGPFDFSEFVRSLTSVYQLLPTYPSYDAGIGQLVRVGETKGIPNVEAQRAADAFAFHQQIRDHVDDHNGESEYEEKGYKIFPVVGIEQPTLQSARLVGGRVEFLTTYRDTDQRGDGTVPRVSATPYELSGDLRDMHAGTRHASLQNADAVLAHMIGAIDDLYLDLWTYRVPFTMPAKLSMDIQDAYLPDEPITLRVRSDREGLDLDVAVVEVDSGRVIARAQLRPSDDGWQKVELAPLSGGVYRITVKGPVGVEPVSDVFTVLDDRLNAGVLENTSRVGYS